MNAALSIYMLGFSFVGSGLKVRQTQPVADEIVDVVIEQDNGSITDFIIKNKGNVPVRYNVFPQGNIHNFTEMKAFFGWRNSEFWRARCYHRSKTMTLKPGDNEKFTRETSPGKGRYRVAVQIVHGDGKNRVVQIVFWDSKSK